MEFNLFAFNQLVNGFTQIFKLFNVKSLERQNFNYGLNYLMFSTNEVMEQMKSIKNNYSHFNS